MADTTEIQSRIRLFILEKFPSARKRALSDAAPLLESGVIDSLGVLDVVTFLEQAFDIKIEDEELTADNFGSIQLLTSFVQKKRTGVTVPVV